MLADFNCVSYFSTLVLVKKNFRHPSKEEVIWNNCGLRDIQKLSMNAKLSPTDNLALMDGKKESQGKGLPSQL